MKLRHFLIHLCTAFTWLATPMIGSAQDFPSRTIRIIVPSTPGGQPDLISRILAEDVSKTIGQPVVVENIPGAGGVAAMATVLAAPADGHILFTGDAAHWAINPALRPKQPNDFLKKFLPIRATHTSSLMLVVDAALPINNLEEFLKLVRSKPGDLTYGSAGVGSIHHLTMEAFTAALGLNIRHIPFKSPSQALPAIASGNVTMMFSAISAVTPFLQTNKVKVLAVSTKNRSRLVPQLPAIAEFGVPDFDHAGGAAILVRVGTPVAVINKLASAFDKAYASPDVISRLNAAKIDYIAQSTPEAAMEQIKSDITRWAAVVKRSGAVAAD